MGAAEPFGLELGFFCLVVLNEGVIVSACDYFASEDLFVFRVFTFYFWGKL